MLGTELCASRIISPFRDGSGDEELSVLPRHTKVIVTGNNRTKSVLVDLQGVVKKAVGLGGWHWLVLKNGVEVKLQRNALSVLEHPTGNEDDSDLDFENFSSDSDMGERNNVYSGGVVFHKHSRPRVRHSKPSFPTPSSKSMNRSSYRDVQSIIHAPKPRVNLAKLGTNTLWRYCRHYKLASVNCNSTREHMLNAVQRHFASQRVDESQVIAGLVHASKKKKVMNS